MSGRRIKNLLKRQIVSVVKSWTTTRIKKVGKAWQAEHNYLQMKSTQWGAQQIEDIARLGQKIYS